jgi:hypothetical protein
MQILGTTNENGILKELIQAEGRTLSYEIHKFINFIWKNEKLPEQWKESIIVPIYNGYNTDCSNYRGISLLTSMTTYKISFSLLLSRQLHMQTELLGIISMTFNIFD